MANPFTYLELHSTDAARAKAFYAELFEWKTSDVSVPDFGTYTEIDTKEGPPAGLTVQREPAARSAWLAYVGVPRLDEAIARAQKLGGRLLTPRTEVKDIGWFAVVQDPAGAQIGLFEKAG
jgi:predicted enzyme related to lactoylglutathione lyase